MSIRVDQVMARSIKYSPYDKNQHLPTRRMYGEPIKVESAIASQLKTALLDPGTYDVRSIAGCFSPSVRY